VGDAKGGAGVGGTNAGNDEWAGVGGTGVGDNDGPAQGVPAQVTTVGPALVTMIEGPMWEVSVHEESGHCQCTVGRRRCSCIRGRASAE
jgi:hypothetical protein